jgi:hypothetical protein
MIRAMMIIAAAALTIAPSARAAGKDEKKVTVTPALIDKALEKPHWSKFLAICKEMLVDENCLFLKSAKDYRTNKDNKARGALAERMMSYYFGASATKQINLPDSINASTPAAYSAAAKAKKYPPALFNEAEVSIKRLLATDLNNASRAKIVQPVFSKIK